MPDSEHRGVKVASLTKAYGALTVLDNISFTVAEGELLAFVGPTGCGKTTFLNCLAGLTAPTSGSIQIGGVPVDPGVHNLAYVLQEPTALPWLTVRENIAYGMRIKGLSGKIIAGRLERILALVGLSDMGALYPNQISASMMQRVAVARAFAVEPDLLLMDEPYGQMDIKLRFYLEDELVRLWSTLKSTVLFVTHNIEEAVYIADRIIILTPKPTTIRSEIAVDLPRPRDVLSPEFLSIRRTVTDLIRWW